MGKKINNYYSKFVARTKRLRWIDILGISVFFFILLVSSFFFLRRPEYVTVTLRLLERNEPATEYNLPKPLYVEKIQPGLKETDQLGNMVVQVLDVVSYPYIDVTQDAYVTLRVRSIYNKKTGQYSYDGLPLLTGDFRSFKLQDVLLSGTIIDVQNEEATRTAKRYLVEGYLDPVFHESIAQIGASYTQGLNINGVSNYLADSVIPGLKMVDSKAEVIAEIKSVKKTPGKISYPSGGSYITSTDPDRKHVELTLEVLAEEIGNKYYFRKINELNVGERIFLTFDNLRIQPTITSVSEIE